MTETLTEFTNQCLSLFGLGLCHQFPERSYHFAEVTWAVCARCSGIYVGLIFALVALLLAYRIKDGHGQRHGFLAWPYWLFLGFGLAFMGWDGVTSYAHIRETTNFLRWVTGIIMGASLAPLVYFLLVNNLAKHSIDKPVLGGPGKEWIKPWLAIAVSLVAAFLFVYPAGPWLGGVGAAIAALCIWVTFALLFLVLLGVFKPFYRVVEGWKNLLLPGAIALVLSLLVIMIISVVNFGTLLQ